MTKHIEALEKLYALTQTAEQNAAIAHAANLMRAAEPKDADAEPMTTEGCKKHGHFLCTACDDERHLKRLRTRLDEMETKLTNLRDAAERAQALYADGWETAGRVALRAAIEESR